MTTNEHELAKQWRRARGWSLDDLAELTGYSRTAIQWFERGTLPSGKEIERFAWHRYKRICHSVAVDQDLSVFKWGVES